MRGSGGREIERDVRRTMWVNERERQWLGLAINILDLYFHHKFKSWTDSGGENSYTLGSDINVW
jgi:hypothetical protein